MGLRKARGFMVYRDSAVLVGRAAEQAMIAGLLARSAHGSALLIRGAPGIGKSALVDDAVVRASRSRKVLRAAGTPSETGMELAEDGKTFRTLDGAVWQQRRRELEQRGGEEGR